MNYSNESVFCYINTDIGKNYVYTEFFNDMLFPYSAVKQVTYINTNYVTSSYSHTSLRLSLWL